MNQFGITDDDLADVLIVLKKFNSVEEAFIFGSRAKGNYKKGSDIDIAVKGKNVNYEIISQINYMLNEETMMPYHFDIVNYNTIKNKNLLDHINRVGVRIYSK